VLFALTHPRAYELLAAPAPDVDAEALRAERAAIRARLEQMAEDEVLGLKTRAQVVAATKRVRIRCHASNAAALAGVDTSTLVAMHEYAYTSSTKPSRARASWPFGMVRRRRPGGAAVGPGHRHSGAGVGRPSDWTTVVLAACPAPATVTSRRPDRCRSQTGSGSAHRSAEWRRHRVSVGPPYSRNVEIEKIVRWWRSITPVPLDYSWLVLRSCRQVPDLVKFLL
jgi:hypothetical protein